MPKGLRIALAAVIGVVALAYGVSPVDLVPELFTGPIGLLDDGAVIAAAIFGIWKLLKRWAHAEERRQRGALPAGLGRSIAPWRTRTSGEM